MIATHNCQQQFVRVLADGFGFKKSTHNFDWPNYYQVNARLIQSESLV